MADDLDIADAMTVEQATSLLPAEAQTTFDRMRDAARAEASRIENSQIARLVAGLIRKPDLGQMRLRDDLVGLMRLVDRIVTDPVILERLKNPPKK